MRRATGHGVGISLGFALCLTLGTPMAGNSAAAQANRAITAQKSPPVGPLERGISIALDQVAFAVEGAESNRGADPQMWGPDPNGPQGPMQVSAAAAFDIGGGDRFDMVENRQMGRAYLARMYRRYGNWPDAITAYNWGPGNMDAWIAGGRPSGNFPLEVERYRDRVLRDAGLDGTSGNPLFYNARPFPELSSPDARRSSNVGPSPALAPRAAKVEGERQLIRP